MGGFGRLAVVLAVAAGLGEVGRMEAQSCEDATPMNLTVLPAVNSLLEDSVCQDGSPAAYFIDVRNAETSSDFLIWLDDTSLCEDDDDCDAYCEGNRNTFCTQEDVDENAPINSTNVECYFDQLRCSSSAWGTLELTGETLLCGDSDSVFRNMKRVFVPSCTLDWFLGRASLTNATKFNGANVLDAVLDSLVAEHGLDGSSTVYIGGSRGGGIGASHHAVRLSQGLAVVTPAETRLILDSSWFVDVKQFGIQDYSDLDEVYKLDSLLRADSAQWIDDAVLSADCVARWSPSNELYKCLYLSNLLGLEDFRGMEVFVMQSQFDFLLLDELDVAKLALQDNFEDPGAYTQAILAYIQGFGLTMRQTFEETAEEAKTVATLSSTHYYWSPACGQHGYVVPTSLHMIESREQEIGDAGTLTFSRMENSFDEVRVGGRTLREALTQWVANSLPLTDVGNNVRDGLRVDRCGDFNCTGECVASEIRSFELKAQTTECEQTMIVGYAMFFLVLNFFVWFVLRVRIFFFDMKCRNFRIHDDHMEQAESIIMAEAKAANKGRSIQIMVHNLSYWSPPRNRRSRPVQILRGVSAVFKPGKIHAIMGPSGSGKSTLLDLISYTREAGSVTGEHLINGVPSHISRAAFLRQWLRNSTSYVRQTDLLYPYLTVRQHLQHSAWLQLPQFSSGEQKLRRVEQVIRLLELDSCADTICGDGGVKVEGGISGGQRRRVSVATQLLSMPAALLLDEPTSGLDSTNALVLVKALESLAHKAGMTIIMTIHQPRREIYTLLDDITILVRGRVVFSGSPEDSASFFNVSLTDVNIGDEILDVLQEASEERIADFRRSYEDENLGSRVMETIENERTELTPEMARGLRVVLVENALASGKWTWTESINATRALWVLASRVIKRGGFDLIQTSLFALLSGLFVGLVFLNNATYTGQIAISFLASSTMTFLISTFLGDRYNLEKGVWSYEKDNGNRVPFQAFMTSIFVRNVVTSTIEALAFAIPVYFMGYFFREPEVFVNYALIMILTAIAVAAQNTTTEVFFIDRGGDGNPDTRTAALINMSLLALSALFNGFIISLSDIPIYLQWFPYIMITFYSFVGLFINSLGPFELECGASELECAQRTGANFVRSFSYDTFDLYLCIFALFCMVIGFQLVSWFGFYFIHVYARQTLKRGAPTDEGFVHDEAEQRKRGGVGLFRGQTGNSMALLMGGSEEDLLANKSGSGDRRGLLSVLISRQALFAIFVFDLLFAWHLCLFTEGADISESLQSEGGLGGIIDGASDQQISLDSTNPGFILINLIFFGLYASQFVLQVLFFVPMTQEGRRKSILWLSRHDLISVVLLMADAALVLVLLIYAREAFVLQVAFVVVLRFVRFCFLAAFYFKVDTFHRHRAYVISQALGTQEVGRPYSVRPVSRKDRKSKKVQDGQVLVAPPPGLPGRDDSDDDEPAESKRRSLSKFFNAGSMPPVPMPGDNDGARDVDLGPLWAPFQQQAGGQRNIDIADDEV